MMFLSPVLVYNNIALRLQLTSILFTLFYVIILSDTKILKSSLTLNYYSNMGCIQVCGSLKFIQFGGPL